MDNNIVQSSTKEHLMKSSNLQDESHLQALNHDGLNTLVLGDKIDKTTFPDISANFQNFASGVDQYNEQIKTFSKQSQLLTLMGDKSGNSQQIDKVVQSLTQSRDKTIQQMEQLALTVKGTQYWNTVDLEDYALVNNKGLSSLSGKEMRQEQVNLFNASHGDDQQISKEDQKGIVEGEGDDEDPQTQDENQQQTQEQPQEEEVQ